MPTRVQYRRTVAKILGPYDQGTADNTSTTSALICLSSPFKSSISQNGRFADRWLYRPAAVAAADVQVVVSAYTASSGTLTPDITYTNQPDGETFEVHGVLPPDGNSDDSLHGLINEALKHCFIEEEVTLAPASATATRHSLASAASWLTNPKWVRQVGYLSSGETRADTDPFCRVVRGEAVKVANTVYLTMRQTFASTTTLYVKVMKPAYYACAAAASPTTFTQSGLSAEADVGIPDEEWVASAVLVLAWQRIGHALEAEAKKGNIRDRAEAAAWFSRKTRENFVRPERTFKTLGTFGPMR